MKKEAGISNSGGAKTARVVVIGAGVSGCACAAALAKAGMHVTLLNPALDRVGEPSFGPELVSGHGESQRVREVLEALPGCIRDAWRKALLVGCGHDIWVCDRRLVSIGVKQALESMDDLELRQGLVVGLEVEGDARIESDMGGERAPSPRFTPQRIWPNAVRIETAFGEELWGDAVVLAVGLSLGSSVFSGETPVGVGRYGQPASEGLGRALSCLGAEMAAVEVELEPRVREPWVSELAARPHEVMGLGLAEKDSCDEGHGGTELVKILLEGLEGRVSAMVKEGPPSPYQERALWERFVLATKQGEDGILPVAWPDGLATGEMAVANRFLSGKGGVSDLVGGTKWVPTVTRPGYAVRGAAVKNLEEGGLLDVPGHQVVPVWITGRAAGAGDYAASLMAGVKTAHAIVDVLRSGDHCG